MMGLIFFFSFLSPARFRGVRWLRSQVATVYSISSFRLSKINAQLAGHVIRACR